MGQLESILIATNSIVQRQKKIDDLPGAVAVLENALLRCKSTIQELKTSVDTLEAFFRLQGHCRKAWASFRTVQRKDEFEGLRKQIHDNMMNLQTALLINTSCLQ